MPCSACTGGSGLSSIPRLQIIQRGKPDDALPGIKGSTVPLPENESSIPGLLNNAGNKVRSRTGHIPIFSKPVAGVVTNASWA